jgi:hypothetical protein
MHADSAYDQLNRLTQVTDPTGTDSFTFDNMGPVSLVDPYELWNSMGDIWNGAKRAQGAWNVYPAYFRCAESRVFDCWGCSADLGFADARKLWFAF